jgi:hypothetical protein
MSASEPIPSPEDDLPPASRPDPSRHEDALTPNDGERPDWLVGAEEGAAAEHARPDTKTPVRLQRPEMTPVEGLQGREAMRSPDGDPMLARPAKSDSGALPGLPLASRRGAESTPAGPAAPQAWTAKGSSIPKLAVVPAAHSNPETADTEDDFDLAGPGGGPEPGLRLVGASDEAMAPRRPTVRPLEEPWWMVLGERVATERPLQLVIAGGIVAIVLGLVFWPHEGRGVSVRNIKKHPEAYEGQTVRVHGQVEEVFPIGNGWVYDLRQGRDTITVFTRGAMPERHQNVNVVGQVSTGYMDGSPRTAILENGGS